MAPGAALNVHWGATRVGSDDGRGADLPDWSVGVGGAVGWPVGDMVGGLVGAPEPGSSIVAGGGVSGCALTVGVTSAGSGVEVTTHESGVTVAVVTTDDPGVLSDGCGVLVGVTGGGVNGGRTATVAGT
jgi:hypothetical protein